MPGGWLSATQVAKALKVTPSRVFQLVRSGQLPAPRHEEGGRFWHQADVDALEAVRAGHSLSRRGEGLAPAPQRLRRVFDGPVEYTPWRAHGPNQVHARVWDGAAAEGRRVVALIGVMSGAYGRHEDSAMAIARQVLEVPAQEVVWFVHRPGRRFEEGFENLVFIWRDDDAGVQAMDRDADAPPSNFSFAPAGWADLEALVGEPVECYQDVGYTEATIRAWQRRRETLDVVHDTVGLRRRMDAIDVLDRRCDDEDHHDDAVAGATLLAEQLREMLDEIDRVPGEDGTETRPGEPPRSWATRRVGPTPNATEMVLLGRYPGPFTTPEPGEAPMPATTWTMPPTSLAATEQSRFAGMIALLDRIQAWRDDVDDAAFRPDPALVAALDSVERALGWECRLLHHRADRRDVPAPPPRTETRIYPMVGPTDEAFLAGLTRLGPDDPLPAGPGAPAARQRRLETRLALDAALYRVDADQAWFGLDPHGHLVAFAPAREPDPTSRGRGERGEQGVIVAEWPLRPPHDPIPDDAEIVADGAVGDRPVYLRWPSGALTPWPGGPRGGVPNMWNFGPDGGIGLAGDILEVLAAADRTTTDALPGRWVNDRIDHSHPDLLRLRIGDIRSRIGGE